MERVKHKRRFRKPRPKWLMKRLSKKEVYSTDEVAIIFGIHPDNVLELVRRGRLNPISKKRPFLFEASTVKGFVRGKPGRKPKPKPKIKRFISKPKSIMRGGEGSKVI